MRGTVRERFQRVLIDERRIYARSVRGMQSNPVAGDTWWCEPSKVRSPLMPAVTVIHTGGQSLTALRTDLNVCVALLSNTGENTFYLD